MIKENNKIFKRGDVILVNLGVREGSVESGVRPAVVIGNSASNLHSPAISVVPLSSSPNKINKHLPTHTLFTPSNSSVEKISVAMAEQITVIDKTSIIKNEPLFKVNEELMLQIDKTIIVQFFGLRMLQSTMAYAM